MPVILVVDDSEFDLAVVKKVFRVLGNWRAEYVNDGARALACLKERRYDLLLTDLHMPQMNGLEFLGHLREHPRFSAIPFILLTAAPPSQWQHQANELGTNAFLPKPFKIDLLKKTIRAVSEASKPSANPN